MSAPHLPQSPARNMAQSAPVIRSVAPAAPVESFIGKAEVARRLNRDVRTISHWMKAGLIPYYKISRSVGFRWSEVETVLRTRFRVNGSGLNNN